MSKYALAQNDDMDMDLGTAKIIVFGVGGGGGNAVEHMVQQGVKGITFVAANTDYQALNRLTVPHKMQIGKDLTRGLGVGGKPEVGAQAAEANEDEIRAMLAGHEMVFIAAGMGGGTGTGSAPVVARIAKEMGILTVGVVTRPFKFEGGRRAKIADQGIADLIECVDSIITIPNEKLLQVYRNLSLKDAFGKVNDVLLQAVDGITYTIRHPGWVNVDFQDVKTAMTDSGYAMMGIGKASGENRAAEATEKAIRSPLMDDLALQNAEGLIINISGANIGVSEPDIVAETAGRIANMDEGSIFYGMASDDDPDSDDDNIYVTVIATGLKMKDKSQPEHVSAYAGSVPAQQPQQPQQAQTAPATQASGSDAQSQGRGQVRPSVQPFQLGDFLQRHQSK